MLPAEPSTVTPAGGASEFHRTDPASPVSGQSRLVLRSRLTGAAAQPASAPAHVRVPSQSESTQHAPPVPHGAQSGPPQSTSVSLCPFPPFEQPASLGLVEGLALGESDGDELGLTLGESDGEALGLALGLALGDCDGEVGNTEGDTVGIVDGDAVGGHVSLGIHAQSQ